MLKITVSHFTNPNGLHVHQTMVGGMPVIAETTDEAIAWAKADEIAEGRNSFRGRGARWEILEWDGDAGVLTPVREGRTAA